LIRLGTGPADLARAAELLRAGELVAFPTETVYGLGADAASAAAVGAVFRVKGRPADHPVIVHLPDASAMEDWARDVAAGARALADAFWPGPLTLVLARGAGVPDIVTGGQDTVGLRVPGSRTAQRLLNAFGGALAAPSANRFGRTSPTTADHVIAELAGAIAAVVDGGPCEVGLESTIVDLSGDAPRLLRPGMIAAGAVEEVLGAPIAMAGDGEGPRASGRLASHYAPGTPLALVDGDRLAEEVARRLRGGQRVIVLAIRSPERDDESEWVRMPDRPERYARRLYAALRQADAAGCDRILVERPPGGPGWDAIRDRLQRAATY
jgi:L-threonylcarbamoyladenylate synthase